MDRIHDRTVSGESSKQLHITKYPYVKGYEITDGLAHLDQDTLQTGVILDYKPSVSGRTPYIFVTLSPEFVQLIRPIKKREVRLPGFDRPVAIGKPEMQKWTVSTSLIIYSGDTVLLGVFKLLGDEENAVGKDSPWVYAFFTAKVVDPLEP